MRPFYDPPYDSPLEDDFARNFVKYVGDLDDFWPQRRINTICGPFIIDFVAKVGGQTIGLECDGKDYHDEWRDEWRDAILLGSGEPDTMYRLRGGDLFYDMDDCLYLISRLDPALFSERGLLNLERLASDSMRSYDFASGPDRHVVEYLGESAGPDPLFVALERRSTDAPEERRVFWRQLHEYAESRGGGSLDALMEEYRSEKGF